jgi:hypothetical protein
MLGLAAALAFVPCEARAQAAAATAVGPADITVGDVFRAAIRVTAPAGAEVMFPDTLDVPADVEAAGRRSLQVDTSGAAPGMAVVTAIYPLAAWRPDTVRLPGAEVVIRSPSGEATVAASFAPFQVTSVLPSDTTDIEPKEAKDVLGANRVWWPILLALLVAAALIAFATWWWRRRRAVPEAVIADPTSTPLERALARLDHALAARLIEAGRMKEFYTLLAEASRLYLADTNRAWGPDLTTTELRARMRADGYESAATELAALLGRADLVKFARLSVDSGAARADAGQVRAWVERFDRLTTPLERAA